MKIVKSVAFNDTDPHELALLNHCQKHKYFSTYIKRLIMRDMENGKASEDMGTFYKNAQINAEGDVKQYAKPLVFEVGKYYQHTTGTQLKIIGGADTTLHGSCLLGEDNYGHLKPIGSDESSAENWFEITEEEWMKNFS